MGARSPKALDFELKRAIADRGGSGIGAGAPTKEPVAKAVGLLSLEIATALGFNARHV
ncbi:hypothetical protein X754_26005 [Mesorhizobium sp. LNJC403B00]|nr:hypothetical protein X754_26005 [Mesorhizobium sp. LNJC403B00]